MKISLNDHNSTYELTIPYKIREIYFNVEKGHYFQTVSGEGAVSVNPNANLFTITVTSENIDGYSVSYANKTTLEQQKVYDDIIRSNLIMCRLDDGTPYLYCGVD